MSVMATGKASKRRNVGGYAVIAAPYSARVYVAHLFLPFYEEKIPICRARCDMSAWRYSQRGGAQAQHADMKDMRLFCERCYARYVFICHRLAGTVLRPTIIFHVTRL